MNDPFINKMRETSWRRKLTAAEEAELRAWLASHPGTQVDWESELALNECLGRLQDVPVPSNFTARTLKSAELERAAARREMRPSGRFWRSFLHRTVYAVTIAFLGLVLYQQHEAVQRIELARKVAAVSKVAAMSDPAVLKDFETIRGIGGPDEELLAVYKLLAVSK